MTTYDAVLYFSTVFHKDILKYFIGCVLEDLLCITGIYSPPPLAKSVYNSVLEKHWEFFLFLLWGKLLAQLWASQFKIYLLMYNKYPIIHIV